MATQDQNGPARGECARHRGGRAARLAALAALLCAPLPAAADAVADAAAPGSCTAAAEQAERTWNLPPGLLGAIGRTESGRPDPLTGRTEPWPWTTNAAGEGRFFGSAAAAVAYVQELQASGVRSIDVGCFQINLMHHPDAFATLQAAFDPAANAEAAAEFLSRLYRQSGGWETAVALYHSALPERGEPYRMQVLARWHGGSLPPGTGSGVAVVRLAADPVVVLLAAGAAMVRVYTPGGASGPAGPTRAASRRLPRVFTPG